MFKRSKKNRQHIVFYISTTLFIGFFWVMPHIIDITPAEIVGGGLDNLTDTYQVIKRAAKIFTQGAAEVVTGIGAIASILYAIWAIKKK